MKKKTEKHLYQKILHLALDIKAFNEQVYDLREVSAEMDYVILINGNSMMHLKGIGENVEIQLKKQKIYPLGIEGKKDSLGFWEVVLMKINTSKQSKKFCMKEFLMKQMPCLCFIIFFLQKATTKLALKNPFQNKRKKRKGVVITRCFFQN